MTWAAYNTMGLDAVIRYTCYARGKTSPPPVKLSTNEWGLPFLDPEAATSPEDFERYVSWIRSCCHHPLMAYASERVGSWGD